MLGPLVRLLQMHDLARLSGGLLWLVQPSDPAFHVGAGLEQVGELLLTILTPPAQLLERQELHRRQLVCLPLVESDEVAVADVGDDFAGAVVLMVGAKPNLTRAERDLRIAALTAKLTLLDEPPP